MAEYGKVKCHVCRVVLPKNQMVRKAFKEPVIVSGHSGGTFGIRKSIGQLGFEGGWVAEQKPLLVDYHGSRVGTYVIRSEWFCPRHANWVDEQNSKIVSEKVNYLWIALCYSLAVAFLVPIVLFLFNVLHRLL